MQKELENLLSAERKNRRQLAELRATRKKVAQQKQPDAKVLAMIDEEIARLLK